MSIAEQLVGKVLDGASPHDVLEAEQDIDTSSINLRKLFPKFSGWKATKNKNKQVEKRIVYRVQGRVMLTAEEQQWFQVLSVKGWPENTIMLGSVLTINVGGQSPDWLLGLLRLPSGEAIARKILARLAQANVE